MPPKLTSKVLAGVIFLLMFLDLIIAPILSYYILQYPHIFEVYTPAQVTLYVFLFEIFLNILIFLFVVVLERMSRRRR